MPTSLRPVFPMAVVAARAYPPILPIASTLSISIVDIAVTISPIFFANGPSDSTAPDEYTVVCVSRFVTVWIDAVKPSL